MIRMFATFHHWCRENGIACDQIEITINPLTADSAARFEAAWSSEMRGLTLNPAASDLPTAGKIYSIPFRYRRPFGNSVEAKG
jgi:hypothetical protein